MKIKNRLLIYALIISGLVLISTDSCKKDKETKNDPIITWANPADISSATLLSAIQLNATANVAGTFVYTPASGTKLNVGADQVLRVDFAPDDSTSYNTASKTVKINVSDLNTVTDIDGNVYNTITIGIQTWMKENLKTTRYRNGVDIPYLTDNTSWSGQTSGAYCWYDNDSSAYKATYGALYNYYTVVDTSNLCPTGWHTPTDVEWSVLTTYLGGESIAGGQMKATTLWISPNTGANNSSGFTALPGGFRYAVTGSYGDIGVWGFWWSATEGDSSFAWIRSLCYDYSGIFRDDGDTKGDGRSVRCVRDVKNL
jgi:uncharacterized protein (TIGR02145 family)